MSRCEGWWQGRRTAGPEALSRVDSQTRIGETLMRIAIVGAGLSGRLLALSASRLAPLVSILMIDRGDAKYMGPAYSSEADYLLLNVPAGRMGALPDDPWHFLKWARQRGVPAEQWDFLSRRLYRDYILDLMREARRERASGAPFEHVRGEVTDIGMRHDGGMIHVGAAESFVVDKVVLALGNFPPRHPSISNRRGLQSGRYVRNPWASGVLDAVASDDTVFLIGTGQTTVDLAVALNKRAHKGRIVAISRHGFLPLVHRGFETYPSFFEEIKDSRRIRDISRTVRAHLKRAESMGIDARAVIDSLRPDTQALWQTLPADEKRRFLRYVFRYWEIIRARIPPESAAIIDAMRASGQLDVIAGRIRDLVEAGSTLEVHYSPRGEARNHVEKAGFVINCMGPESDYGRIDDILVTNLMRRGLIRPGPANIGIDCLPNGAIIARDGAASRVLYTLGSPMKGVLWEVLAVPEIRAQAQRLAHLLLKGVPEGPGGEGRGPGSCLPE